MGALTRREIMVKIRDIPNDILQCMVFGHLPGPTRTQTTRIDRHNVYEMATTCMRCESLKLKYIRVSNGQFARSTKYKKGPGIVSTGLGQITKEVNGLLRLEAINRGLDGGLSSRKLRAVS